MKIAERCLGENTLVAAICGATIALAGKGLLNTIDHTSNNLHYLKTVCPGYTDERF